MFILRSMNIYKAELTDHYRNPRNYGKLDNPDMVSGEYNPSCGDSIEIEAIIKNGIISKVAFTGKGCVISQGLASMLTEAIIGKTIDDILKLNNNFMFDLLGFSVGPNRSKCATLSLEALKNGLLKYLEESKISA
jgi:nitrogen fixation protein NifU and related proteins